MMLMCMMLKVSLNAQNGFMTGDFQGPLETKQVYPVLKKPSHKEEIDNTKEHPNRVFTGENGMQRPYTASYYPPNFTYSSEDERLWAFSFKREVFEFNKLASKWIFWGVLAISTIGFGSGVYLALRNEKIKGSVEGNVDGTFKIKGLGALILATSLLFFFLYLKYVYPLIPVPF